MIAPDVHIVHLFSMMLTCHSSSLHKLTMGKNRNTYFARQRISISLQRLCT